MISISILKHNGIIEEMNVSGHAEYADKGKDLVCAGVSTIMIGSLNALDLLAKDTCDLQIKANQIQIKTKINCVITCVLCIRKKSITSFFYSFT